MGLQPATFCNFYPSRFLGCGARRNVLIKVESSDEDLAEPDSAKYESNSLNPDEKALYPLSRYGARRNVLIKVESSDEELDDTVSPKSESGTLNSDEKTVFTLEGFFGYRR